MSKITLPTSGSRNWGGSLNAYLEHLDSRLSTLESFHNTNAQSTNDDIINVGYPCSGLIGEVDIQYSNKTVSFSGNVYIGSNTNCYFRNVSLTENLTSLALDKYYFVFLKYFQGNWDIECYQEFKVDDTYVLLGMYYNDNFIPYYFSSSRNLSMHLYDLQHRWADFNQANVLINIDESGNLDLDNTLINNSYKIYCEGLGMTNIRPSLLNSTGCVKIDRGANVTQNKILIEDREEEGVIKSFNVTNFVATSLGSGICYRLLVDIFGNLIIQKSVDKNLFSFDNGYWCEQQLYNTRFNHFTNCEAGLWVEIGRFGYNQGDVIDFCYDQANFTNGLTNFTFGKARNYDTNQLSNNIWLTKDSQIWLDKVEFKNNLSSEYSFSLSSKPYTETLSERVHVDPENCEIYGEGISFYNITDGIEYKLFKTITLPYNDTNTVNIITSGLAEYNETVKFSDLRDKNFIKPFVGEDGLFSGDFIVSLTKQGDKAEILIYCHKDGIGEDATDLEVVNYWHSNHWQVSFGILVSSALNVDNQVIFDFQSARGKGVVLWQDTHSEKPILMFSTSRIQLTSGFDANINSQNILFQAQKELQQSASIINLQSENKFNIKSKTDINFFVNANNVLKMLDEQVIYNVNLQMSPGANILVYSDERLKTNIKTIDRTYSKIIQDVPVVNFNYKNDNQLQVGIIAQHLQKALQKDWDLFITCQDNNLSIKESKLVYLLWAALQEEISQRIDLENRISAWESYYETKQ